MMKGGASGRRLGARALDILTVMALALITGGSRGIGAATAVRLAQDGHDIAVAYCSSAEAAERVAGEVHALGRRAATFAADMADAEATSALVAAVGRELGRSRFSLPMRASTTPSSRIPARSTRRPGTGRWRSTCELHSFSPGPRSAQ
jgi:hypothetical protein